MYRSSNPEAPVWNKTIASLMGNVVYSSRFLVYPFREMNNMPDKLMKQIPELVKCSPALILAGRDDILIPPIWLESGANRLKDAGRDVTFADLDGQHCTMLRESPADYERTVLDFFNTNEIN